MSRIAWSHDETLMVLGLYLLPPANRLNWDDPDDVTRCLAKSIGRTPDAVCFKLANITACDANRRRYGFGNGSKMDRHVMEEYLANPDETLSSCLDLLNQKGIAPVETQGKITLRANLQPNNPGEASEGEAAQIAAQSSLPERKVLTGTSRATITFTRVNQAYFRRTLLYNYNGRCCLTCIDMASLLIASHIKPWAAATPAERTAASNGILLNAFHDKAFDKGFITLDDKYRVRVSSYIEHTDANDCWLWSFDGKRISLPEDESCTTWPNKDFLHYHNDCVFEHFGEG